MKLCECGCGEVTAISTRTRARRGHVKGQPQRFIKNHQSRSVSGRGATHSCWKGGRRMADGYVQVWTPGHPRATPNGYVMEHLLIAEKVLGRPLTREIEVHHVNKQRADNRPCNLVICENHAYHVLLHKRLRAYKASGHVDWRRCQVCKQYDDPINLHKGSRTAWHPHCANKRRREQYALKRVVPSRIEPLTQQEGRP